MKGSGNVWIQEEIRISLKKCGIAINHLGFLAKLELELELEIGFL